MSKAPMNRNPAKVRYGANTNRPTGAGRGAESNDIDELAHAARYGNRATRRLAQRNLRKRLKAEGLNR